MNTRSTLISVFVLALTMLTAGEVLAQSTSPAEPSAGASCHSATPAAKPNKMAIPDVKVLDQEGHALNFYTDLIKDKTVAINFIFTNCTTICPPLAATFARLQKEMGDKIGKRSEERRVGKECRSRWST